MLLNAVYTHLWQSTVFAAFAAVLAFALRSNHARTRYWLWLAASMKFLVPFAALVTVGRQLGWRSVHAVAHTPLTIVFGDINKGGRHEQIRVVVNQLSANGVPGVAVLLGVVWICGCLFVLCRWMQRWRRLKGVVRAAVNVTEGREYEVLRQLGRTSGVKGTIGMRISAARMEPGIFGVVRPVLLWPAGISDRLSRAQIEAIMAHEMCHVRRRDNLTAVFYMTVEAIFWFHPLVWWLGTRLVDERENACDEEVLRQGSEPEIYAESILRTCQFYLESPVACMAGVTGADLKKRIERIMTHRFSARLELAKKVLLTAAGFVAVAGPIMIGILTGPVVRGQSKPATQALKSFEVASIKRNTSDDHRVMFNFSPGGRITMTNASIKMLLMNAYQLKQHQLAGAPGWMDSERYDIVAKSENSATPEEVREMLQSLLAERFKLTFHRETKEQPIYALVVGKSGPKLKPSAADGEQKSMMRMSRGSITLEDAQLSQLADAISNIVGRTVLDRTGIKGRFEMKLEWTPDEDQSGMLKGPGENREGSDGAPSDSTGPSIFNAVQEQLGLKLEAQKGQVEILTIDHVEKPTEN